MFSVKPSSERAKKIFAPIVTNKLKFEQARIDKKFPFNLLGIGQSFFIKPEECSNYDLILAKERLARYNRKYAVYFVALKHGDCVEVARIA